jgi:hypothetical protein
MSEQKPARPEATGVKSVRSEHAGQKPHTSEATMHMDAQARKSGGRLSREDQRRLGDILQRAYDDVLRQGVPDRFKDLLKELDQPRTAGEANVPSAREKSEETGQEPDRLVAAKQFSHNKGSS